MRMSWKKVLAASVAVAVLIATYFLGKATSVAAARGDLAGAPDSAYDESTLAGAGANWIISSTIDQMTDVAVATAALAVAGEQFDTEVTVSCGSDGNIEYRAASFDKAREPAEMRSVLRTSGYDGYTRTFTAFEMRGDDHAAIRREVVNPEYNNQVQLTTGPVQALHRDGSGVDDAEQMAASSQVVLRLFMTTGDETFVLPQAAPAFRKVVGPCLTQRQIKRQELTAHREQGEAAERAAKEAYIYRLYDDPGVDADTLAWLASNRGLEVDQARLEAKRRREANLQTRPESNAVVSGM